MSWLQRVLSPNFISQCAEQLSAISPNNANLALRFCEEHAKTLFEIKKEGWHIEGCVNLLSIYMLSTPARYIGYGRGLGEESLLIAHQYANRYIELYPTAGASSTLADSLEMFSKSKYKLT